MARRVFRTDARIIATLQAVKLLPDSLDPSIRKDDRGGIDAVVRATVRYTAAPDRFAEDVINEALASLPTTTVAGHLSPLLDDLIAAERYVQSA